MTRASLSKDDVYPPPKRDYKRYKKVLAIIIVLSVFPVVTWIAGDPIWIGLLIDAVMIAVVALTFFLLWLIS